MFYCLIKLITNHIGKWLHPITNHTSSLSITIIVDDMYY